MLRDWGATPEEVRRHYPALDLRPDANLVLHRAVGVDAPDARTWRWVCQLAVAPYSYDWVDNLGRRSPRELTPGVDALVVGQRMTSGFRLGHVEPGRSLTIVGYGSAITYEVRDGRLVGCLACRLPRPLHIPLAAGDLVMMRKQLLTLKELAER